MRNFIIALYDKNKNCDIFYRINEIIIASITLYYGFEISHYNNNGKIF